MAKSTFVAEVAFKRFLKLSVALFHFVWAAAALDHEIKKCFLHDRLIH